MTNLCMIYNLAQVDKLYLGWSEFYFDSICNSQMKTHLGPIYLKFLQSKRLSKFFRTCFIDDQSYLWGDKSGHKYYYIEIQYVWLQKLQYISMVSFFFFYVVWPVYSSYYKSRGGFPMEIKTKIRYFIICGYHIFTLWKYDNNKQ